MSSKNSEFDSTFFDKGPSSKNVVSSKLVISAIVFFFVIVIFVAVLDLLARRRWGASTANSRRGRTRSRLIFQADRDVASAPSGGLPAQALEALPISIYRSSDWEETTECAVCLSEIDDGEKIRLLPSCKHCFHVDCIDMWFHSHSTCPLCRNSVTDADGAVAAAGDPNETSRFGSGAPLGTAIVSDRALVIEIPRRTMDAFTSPTSSSLSTSRRAEEMKSPAMTSATPSRLRSLKRMLSRDKRRAASSSCSSPYTGNGGDLEMGLIGASSTAAEECDDGKGSHKNL